MAIELYGGLDLSLRRAVTKAPEFAKAYQWFINNQNAVGQRPYGKYTPPEVGFPLAAQRGIHKPKGSIYALSITSTNNESYAADAFHELDDGTWVLQYCAHHKSSGEKEGSPVYNQALRNCLKHGLPVGVFLQKGASYRCLGLAFVERFNTATNMFWLHGPVLADESQGSLSPLSVNERRVLEQELGDYPATDFLIDEQLGIVDMSQSALQDERDIRLARIVRRKQQGRFRRMLLEAYNGQCAISGYDAEPALQAAHISSYLGPKSQAASNGLLLRADLHLLYDNMLLSVDPDNMRIHLASALMSTRYEQYEGLAIRLPRNKDQRPSPERLAAQYADFCSTCKLTEG